MEEWKLRRLILSGRARKIVFKSLVEKPKIAKEIALETKLLLSNVNRILTEFEEIDLVKNLTPNDKRNRVFGLTRRGRNTVKELKEKNIL